MNKLLDGILPCILFVFIDVRDRKDIEIKKKV